VGRKEAGKQQQKVKFCRDTGGAALKALLEKDVAALQPYPNQKLNREEKIA